MRDCGMLWNNKEKFHWRKKISFQKWIKKIIRKNFNQKKNKIPLKNIFLKKISSKNFLMKNKFFKKNST